MSKTYQESLNHLDCVFFKSRDRQLRLLIVNGGVFCLFKVRVALASCQRVTYNKCGLCCAHAKSVRQVEHVNASLGQHLDLFCVAVKILAGVWSTAEGVGSYNLTACSCPGCGGPRLQKGISI